MANDVQLNYRLLIACILIGVATILYLFFWNRLLAGFLNILLRIWGWKGGTSSIWIQFSMLSQSKLTHQFLMMYRFHTLLVAEWKNIPQRLSLSLQ
jgi:hypothetical protein